MPRKIARATTRSTVFPNPTLLFEDGTQIKSSNLVRAYSMLGSYLEGTAGGGTITGTATATAPTTINARTPGKRGRKKMSAAGRQRLAAAQTARWAKIKAGKKPKSLAANA